jgi:hypothetical protein
MNMKDHILTALREQIDQWEEVLGRLTEEQIITARLFSDWSVKDNIAHLWAWQQRSIARFEGARMNRKPEFPKWAETFNPEQFDDTDVTNDWIYKNYRDLPWSEVHQNWREGFNRLIEIASGFSEMDLLNGDKFPWLDGSSLSAILLGTYDHHQEHIEKLLEKL